MRSVYTQVKNKGRIIILTVLVSESCRRRSADQSRARAATLADWCSSWESLRRSQQGFLYPVVLGLPAHDPAEAVAVVAGGG